METLQSLRPQSDEMTKMVEDQIVARIIKGQRNALEQLDKLTHLSVNLEDYIVPTGIASSPSHLQPLEFYREMKVVGESKIKPRLIVNLRSDEGVEDPTMSDLNASLMYKDFTMHRHALGQIGDKFDIPRKYLYKLLETDWGISHLADTLFIHNEHAKQPRLLLRTVNGEIRGVLSEKYRRMNSPALVTQFIKQGTNNNLVVADAHVSDTKMYVEMLRPKALSINTTNNGVINICYGARLRNSDFGDGALEIRSFMMQGLCLNGWVSEAIMSKVHLGPRIPDNIEISDQTLKLDTAAIVSLINDTTAQITSPEFVERMSSRIYKASETIIDVPKELVKLPKLGMTKTEVDDTSKLLFDNDPNNGLEGKPTKWKLGSAITALARDNEDLSRKRMLEEIGSKYAGLVSK